MVVTRFWWWLALITVGALILRVVVVLHARNVGVVNDGYYYHVQANQIAHGRLFLDVLHGQESAANPPGWVVVLTAFTWLGGHTILQQQLLACVIGMATVVLIGLAGRRIAGEWVGLLAAGIAAVYAGLWVYERALLSETLVLPIIAGMILVAYRFRDRPSALSAALLGVVCGVLVRTRSEQILVLPLIVLPLMLMARRVGWRRRFAWLALASLALVVVLAPWTIYNIGRFKQPVLLSTGAGLTGANCDATYYGSNIGGSDLKCALGGSSSRDQTVADSEDRRISLTYADTHIGRLPFVLVAREGRAFGFWSPLQQTVTDSQERSDLAGFASLFGVRSSNNASDLWVGRLGLYGYWLLLTPAVAGAIILRRRKIPLYPLIGFVAGALITVAVTFGKGRFRAGAEVPLVLLAAIGIDALLSLRRRRPSVIGGTDELQRGTPPGATLEMS